MNLRGYPTLIASGLIAGAMWGGLAYMVPAKAFELPTTTSIARDFERVRHAMPTFDTFLGIRAVFQKIDQQIGRGR